MLLRYDEDDVTAFPVVKETGDKLIETGINTLQRTLLLKKEVEVDQVQAELEEKRREFKQRMDACAQRQIEIQKQQQRVSFSVSQENEHSTSTFVLFYLIHRLHDSIINMSYGAAKYTARRLRSAGTSIQSDQPCCHHEALLVSWLP